VIGLVVVISLAVACSDSSSGGGVEGAAGRFAAPESGAAAWTNAGSPDSLLARGISLYYHGDVEGAHELFAEALEGSVQLADNDARAQALTWLGINAWKHGDYDEARLRGEEALALKLEANLTHFLWRSYNALGLLAWYESRLTDAADLFDSALEAAQAASSEEGIVAASGNRGLIHFEFGEFAEARRRFSTASDGGRALGDPIKEGNALTNLAMLDIQLGDPRSAIPRLEEARRLFRAGDSVLGEENALGQLGSAYLVLGEVGRAHAKFDSALALAREQGLKPEEAMNLEMLAELFMSAGDDRRALRFYAEARELNSELGDEIYAGADLRSEAVIYASLGDLGSAFERAASALEMHRSAGARFQELLDLVVLAEVAQRRRRPADVARYLGAADQLADELEARAARVAVALTRARIADAEGEPSEALRALASIRADLSRGDYGSEWEAESLRARAHFQLGSLDSAAVAGRRAVEASERIRKNLGSGVLRSSLTAARAGTYSDLVAILLRSGDVEEAFQVADAARGHSVREYLVAAEHAPLDATVRGIAQADELLRRIDQLTAALDTIETVPARDRDPETARAITRRLDRARSEFENLLIQLAEQDPLSAAALGGGQLRLGQVQSVLGPGEVLLEYLVTAERLLIFVIWSEGMRIAESTITAANLTSRLRVARDLMGRPDARPEAVNGVLAELYDILIEPAARAAPVYDASALIIVPHGVLNYLPFAALLDDVTGRYLTQAFTLLHLPSAAALPLLREASRGRRARPADRSGPSTYVFAPFPERLPATRAEALGLGEALRDVSVAIGPEAREADLRRALRSGSVHLATHGSLNVRNPMFSRLDLAKGRSGRSEDDGRLEVHEVLGLSIHSPLVYLSGCETGLGGAWSTRFAQGEDYATLAQAFLYAGARNVIATLWRIEDEGAAEFARLFYGELQGVPPAEALARTQRLMMEIPERSSPYYWAAYRLSGTGT
jgi:CHAT domain-containing protein